MAVPGERKYIRKSHKAFFFNEKERGEKTVICRICIFEMSSTEYLFVEL